jgi:Ribonucleotide reductase alpha domain/LAGLIDADG-like domain
MTNTTFPALTGNPVYYRTYSRFVDGKREEWAQTVDRVVAGLIKLGNLTTEQSNLIREEALALRMLPAGRSLWVGGTPWAEQPENFSGNYNCSSYRITSFERMAFMMGLLMQGCGVGTVLESDCIEQLPPISCEIDLTIIGKPGDLDPIKNTCIDTVCRAKDRIETFTTTIIVGDSRKGWTDAYQQVLELAANPDVPSRKVVIELGRIRAAGTKIKGFGGVANPVGLPRMFAQMVKILNGAVGRQLNSVEVCLLLDEASVAVVAGNVRRSANIRQFSDTDTLAATAKDNLWIKTDGVWSIDPDRDALRMGNHTLVFHSKPSLIDCIEAVTKQYHSGEGAIMWAGEAVARANADLLTNDVDRRGFLQEYNIDRVYAGDYLEYKNVFLMSVPELEHRMNRFGMNPCFAAGTKIVTRQGHHNIENLVGYDVDVWDGHRWILIDNFRVTGENQQVFEVLLSNGEAVIATADHNFVLESGKVVKLSELKNGDCLKTHSISTISQSSIGMCHRSRITVEKITIDGIADKVYCCTVPTTSQFALTCGIIVGNCGEIIGDRFQCNLADIHLNQFPDCLDLKAQSRSFKAAAITVSTLLHHKFVDPEQQFSRELDPIVGVSFTGLFDFFVNAFGIDWLKWWAEGRGKEFYMSPDGWVKCRLIANLFGIEIDKPLTDQENNDFYFEGEIYRALEAAYLNYWRGIVEENVGIYCAKHGLKVPNRSTTVQPSGCLDRTALRIFDQGLLYADEIVAKGSGETVGLDLSVRSGIAVNTAIANQPLNLIKVTLRNGRQLRMTTNHRISIRGEWVEAVDLEPGMVIDYQIGCYQKLDDVKLIGINPENYTRAFRAAEVGNNQGVIARTISTPSLMSPDLGYFLGALFGNGCFSPSKYRVRFAHEYISVLNRLSQIGQDLFEIEGNLHKDPMGGRSELCFASKQLFDWFHQNNIAKTVKSKDLDRIPEPIRRSSQNTLLSFFCGLIDTDGCIRKDGKLSIDSASENFIRNLQQVGESIGLSFGISHNTQGSNHQAVKSIWSLSLSRTKSTRSAINYLNQHSIKAQLRPISFSTKTNGRELYAIVSVEPESVADYSYDFAVEGVNDDDAWYWQGGLKSHNTKSLLTGASPGWHPPKAAHFVRRITFGRENPVAMACLEYGYNVIPSQTDKDEHGNLLDDPFDPRCTEWLVEIPIATNWANLEGADDIDISQFSALAQFDFYMGVQQNYTRHNTSATIELREHEIKPLATAIHEAIQEDNGYISAALLKRFDGVGTFPRLPFEPINKAAYDQLVADVASRSKGDDFGAFMAKYDAGELTPNAEAAGCDSDKCLMPVFEPKSIDI